MRNIFPFLLIVFISASSCTKTIYVSVMKPAQITVPQHVQTLALINRTLPIDEKLNIIEGILTAETPGQDKQGALEALAGLNAVLQSSPRYTVKLTDIKLKGSGAGGVFPDALSWAEIEEICRNNQADALISLETYDSDFIVTNATKLVDKKKEDGTTVKVTQYYAEGVATVKLGFRLYDPKVKTIADQYHFVHTMRWSTSGNSPQEALAKLIGRNQAINRVSNDGGASYAYRIAPNWTRVSRQLYKKAKGNSDVAMGTRRALVNDWEGAEQAWERVVKISRGKTAAKAAFNLALANEVQGDLYTAKKWVQVSYVDYGFRKARNYAAILDGRIWEQQRLEEQMGQ